MTDSEYSDIEEEEQFQGATTVSLGFADEKADEATVYDNHLGGQPVKPSDQLTKCKSCNKRLPLIAQIFAPLEGTYYDRALYVFACGDAGCRRKKGSVRALRSIRRDAELEAAEKKREEDEKAAEEKKGEEKKREIEQMSKNIFSSETSESNNAFASANPFEQSDPFATKKQEPTKPQEKENEKEKTAASTTTTEKKPVSRGQVYPAYPCYYITVENEYIGPQKPDPIAEKAKPEILDEAAELDVGDEPGSSSAQKELINEIEAASNDQVFQKFVRIVEHNPDQVVRYDQPLEPLLYSGEGDVAKMLTENAIPKAPNGSNRQIELQVMPHAIMVLEEEYQDIANGMEWGSIFVATPQDDTIEPLDKNGVGYSEEWVGVQWEQQM
ncbi:hypothetical protein TRICI_005002 [Trichomonascus ciferrii]|uniref:Programmed cell death protein 2 C-terminal domain-containing protein n=1 Tax=Trichomonascus ciferrii TaxID=44093 RepID=A0A642UXR9_9ASCO|nr:hypothetical protein TRICI_005002 [Trichomonascus ciferrii]